MEEFKFERIFSGYMIGSLSGMLRRVKAIKIRHISMKNGISGFNIKTKDCLISELLEKLNDYKMKKMLSKIKDKYIQPSSLIRFKRNKDNMVNLGLIAYEKNDRPKKFTKSKTYINYLKSLDIYDSNDLLYCS